MFLKKRANRTKNFNFKFFMAILHLATFLISHNLCCQTAKTVITIDNIVQELDEKTSCDVQFWANKLENSCKCCLIKQIPQLRSKKATEILNNCIIKKLCSAIVIDKFLLQEKISDGVKDEETRLRELLSALYNRSVLIKEVEAKEITFDQAGNFNEDSVANFLAKAYKEQKLTNPDFQNASCIKAKDIIGQKGYQTKQLFLVTSKCIDENKPVEYIFKEIASGTAEILRLEKSVLVPQLAPYVYPKKVEGFPSFIFPVAYISYNYDNKEHYLSLMLKSPGVLLSSLISDFRNGTETQAEIEEAYYQTGKALGKFHLTFMDKLKRSDTDSKKELKPTLIHGDGHQGNIFYDKNTKQVLYIDNERIASSSPGAPWTDIKMFIFTTLDLFTPNHLKQDVKFINNWLSITIKNFIKGYADAYLDKPEEILKEIYDNIQRDDHYQNYKETIDTVFKQLNE